MDRTHHIMVAVADQETREHLSEYLKKNESIEKVYFVCFDNENYEIYRKKLKEEGII